MTPELLAEQASSATVMMPYSPFQQAATIAAECDPRIVFLHDLDSPAAEQYRRIASRLVSRNPAGGAVMITSAAPDDGKTLSAINMAFCMAERGPALLVDLDTRHCSVRPRLALRAGSPSIEDALLELVPPEEAIVSFPGTRLCVACNRGDRYSVVDLMGSGRPKRFLDWALKKFRWVILDTPPAFPIADTLEIAQHATVGILVVRSRKTPARLARLAIDALKGRIQFVVLNDSQAPGYSIYNKCYQFDSSAEKLG